MRNIGSIFFAYILFNLKKMKNFIEWKKRYTWKRTQRRYFGMQIMTAKTTTGRTLFVQVVLNGVSFFTNFMILLHMLETFYLSSFMSEALV